MGVSGRRRPGPDSELLQVRRFRSVPGGREESPRLVRGTAISDRHRDSAPDSKRNSGRIEGLPAWHNVDVFNHGSTVWHRDAARPARIHEKAYERVQRIDTVAPAEGGAVGLVLESVEDESFPLLGRGGES